ncbi:MAG: hypothetical protein ACFE68_03220 [Candidatus Hodarchaeota archaeon]
MSEKEGQIPSSYKIGFVIGFTLLLLGGIFFQVGIQMWDQATIDYPQQTGDDYKEARKNGLWTRTFATWLFVIGGFIIAILALFLALNPQLVESETFRASLLIFAALILAFIVAWNGVALTD